MSLAGRAVLVGTVIWILLQMSRFIAVVLTADNHRVVVFGSST